MPLKLGTSDKTRAKNTAQMINAGYAPKQAVATAVATQRKAQTAKQQKPVFKPGKKGC